MEWYDVIFILILFPFAIGVVGFWCAAVLIAWNVVKLLIQGVRGKI